MHNNFLLPGFNLVFAIEFDEPSLAGLDTWSGYLESLDVLLPSFLVGFGVAIVASLWDKQGQARMAGVAEELRG